MIYSYYFISPSFDHDDFDGVAIMVYNYDVNDDPSKGVNEEANEAVKEDGNDIEDGINEVGIEDGNEAGNEVADDVDKFVELSKGTITLKHAFVYALVANVALASAA